MYSLDSISSIGSQLQRPECVLTTSNERIYCSNWDGGVTVIENDGQQFSILANNLDFRLKPNGICLLEDGSFLIAHLGEEEGGVYQLFPDGSAQAFLTHLDNKRIPPTNFVHLDYQGRIWITVSTKTIPRAAAYRSDVQDGFIILYDKGEARIVADNLGYTNECLVSEDGNFLYVNETFSRRLSRFDISEKGDLTNKVTLTHFDKGVFPDGLVKDDAGYFWVTSIVSNQIIRVAPDGKEQATQLIDVDENHLDWVETAFLSHSMGRPHLDQVKSQKLKNISSLAFGGPDRNTIFLGCLLGHQISKFKQNHTGLAPSHWLFNGPNKTLVQSENKK